MRDYVFSARIALGLAAVALLVRLLDVQRTAKLVQRLAGRFPANGPGWSDPIEKARRLARRVAAMADGMPLPPRCLTRSLLLAGLLWRHGQAARVWIGVGLLRDFAAHAWVELDGVPINDTVDVAARYRPLWNSETFPA